MADTDPLHVRNFLSNISEIRRLVEIHDTIAGTGMGHKAGVEVLNKSAVVLLVACWEAFIEDLAAAAFDAMIANATSPSQFPNSVLTLASQSLRESPDARDVWQLAGDGWRSVLLRHKSQVRGQFIAKLNTPRPKKVDEVFNRLLGLRSLSSSWKWPGMSAQKATQKLEGLVTLRGE